MKYTDIEQIPQEGDIVGLEFGDVMIEGKFVEYLDDGIVLEMNNKGERLLKEFLPLIPAAVWAGGAAWSAYDAFQAKKAYDRGEITKADLAKRIGTDAALTIIGGGLAKGAVKATKAITKAVKIAYFLLLARSSGVIIPVLTSNNKMTGNSKHNPKAKMSFIINERYSDILGSSSIGSEPSTLLT